MTCTASLSPSFQSDSPFIEWSAPANWAPVQREHPRPSSGIHDVARRSLAPRRALDTQDEEFDGGGGHFAEFWTPKVYALVLGFEAGGMRDERHCNEERGIAMSPRMARCQCARPVSEILDPAPSSAVLKAHPGLCTNRWWCVWATRCTATTY